MASSAPKRPELIKEIIRVYDELQDCLKGPIIHISKGHEIKTLKTRLNELRDAADKYWGKTLNPKNGPQHA